jgi:polar amino acid transport system substrate-binding protein
LFWTGLITSCCYAQSASNTLILYTEEFPPYNFTQDSQLKGINADVVNALCENAGFDCEIRVLPWGRAYGKTLNERNSGLFSTSRILQREELFKWVGPIVFSNACFYKLKSRQDITVKNQQDLQNYTVGLSRNDIYQLMLENMGLVEDKHFLTYSQKHHDSKLFAAGKLDLIIGSSLTLMSQLNTVGLSVSDVTPVFELNDDALKGNFIAFNKETDPALIEKLQNALGEIKKSGAIERIAKRYVQSEAVTGTIPQSLQICANGMINY